MMKEKKDFKKIIKTFKKWVSLRGNGKFIDRDFIPMENLTIPEDWGIQQIYEEISEFAKVLIDMNLRKSILEIGLGYFGSTHFLWRQIFDKVMTIEKDANRVREFGTNLRLFYKDWILKDKRSSFVIGLSNSTDSVEKVYNNILEPLDVLFIDGDHSISGVLTDWLLYSPLVKKGGIVAFHDIQLVNNEVGDFIRHLERGFFNEERYHIYKIIYSKNVGIGYYVKMPHGNTL